MFGEKIKFFGKSHYGSVKSLAEALEMLPQQLSTYISEVKKPGFEVLAKLKGLGCDMNWLIDESEPIGELLNPPKRVLKSNAVQQLSEYELMQLRAVIKANAKDLEAPRSKKVAG